MNLPLFISIALLKIIAHFLNKFSGYGERKTIESPNPFINPYGSKLDFLRAIFYSRNKNVTIPLLIVAIITVGFIAYFSH